MIEGVPPTPDPPRPADPRLVAWHELDDLINEVAGILLAGSGREADLPRLLDDYPRGRAAVEAYLARTGPDHSSLARAIGAYDPLLRVPFLGFRPAPVGPRPDWWSPPPDLRRLLFSSPLSEGTTPARLDSAERRIRRVNWRPVGSAIDHHVRGFFGLPTRVPLSVHLLGSYVWGAGAPQDLDLTVVVEGPFPWGIETGGSRPALECPGLASLFPAAARPLSDRLDVAVVGRGALKEGTFSHDLINTVVWSTLGGLPLTGGALVTGLSDFTVGQSVLVTLGYAMKHTLVGGGRGGPKQFGHARSQLGIVVSLARKYRLPALAEWEGALRSFDEVFSGKSLWEVATFTAQAVIVVLTAIRERCRETLESRLEVLREWVRGNTPT